MTAGGEPAAAWRLDPRQPFRWQDGERTLLFGTGCVERARELIGHGYALLCTPRSLAQAPWLADAAAAVHEVGSGQVDALAGELREQVSGETVVALGGGRVIDTAKALAAADPPRRVIAIPTTLSGAEMTPVHRHARGVAEETPRVRPAVVLNDPGLCATQPLPGLAESAGNALGHAIEGPLTPFGNPAASLAACAAAVQLADGLLPAEPGGEPDRDALALGALLAGFVIGSTHYGLHHVLSQTLAREAGVRHGQANAIVLPHSTRALARRAPAALERMEAAVGESPARLAERFAALTGAPRLREAGVTEADLDRCAEAAAGRPELALTPPPAERDELREIYARAY